MWKFVEKEIKTLKDYIEVSPDHLSTWQSISMFFFITSIFILLLPFLSGLETILLITSPVSLFFPKPRSWLKKISKKLSYIHISVVLAGSILILFMPTSWDNDSLLTYEEAWPVQLTSDSAYLSEKHITNIFNEDTDYDMLKDDFEKKEKLLVINNFFANENHRKNDEEPDICRFITIKNPDITKTQLHEACRSNLPKIYKICKTSPYANLQILDNQIECANISLSSYNSISEELYYRIPKQAL